MFITIENEKESIIFFELINIACFNSKYSQELDGNFITIYNKEKDEFDYFIERLVGHKIENERNPYLGKIWVPYINSEKEDWSIICQKNRIISKQDDICFRFEVFNSEDNPN
jgi:hypothetical protein